MNYTYIQIIQITQIIELFKLYWLHRKYYPFLCFCQDNFSDYFFCAILVSQFFFIFFFHHLQEAYFSGKTY